MNKPLLLYSAQITGQDQAQAIDIVRKTLLTQSDSLSSSLVGLFSPTLFDELRTLLDVWHDATGGSDEFGVSMSVKMPEISASVSMGGKIIASASEVIHSISIDREHFDIQRHVDSNDLLDLPIKVELETQRSVGDLSLSCNQTAYFAVTGNYADIMDIMNVLDGDEPTTERLSNVYFCFTKAHVDPQTIKLDITYCTLSINGVETPFRENSLQMKLLRAMFGQQGRNHIMLKYDTLFDIYDKDEQYSQSWEGYSEKATFIKQTRNTVAAINNKVRRFVNWTEDFLEVKDHACRINPQLIAKN